MIVRCSLALALIGALASCAGTKSSGFTFSGTAPINGNAFAGPNPAPATALPIVDEEALAATSPALSDDPLSPDDPALVTNEFIIDLIKRTNGFRAEAERTDTGLWVIGYGTMSGSRPEAAVTEADADAMLRQELATVENSLKKMLRANAMRREFSAMVDLARDIGTAAFANSAVLRNFNAGRKAKAADAFMLWNSILIDGEWKVDPVLDERRSADRAHFLGGAPAPN